MRHRLSIFFGIFYFLGVVGLAFANNANFNARISDGTSYYTGTSFSNGPFNLNTNTSLDFENVIQTTLGSGAYTYSVNFPGGYQYVSSVVPNTIGPGCTGPTGLTPLDTLYRFTLPDSNCMYEFYYKYKPTTTGNNAISLIASGSTTYLISNISVNVIGSNTFSKAESLDTNNNGFLDAYKITFSQNTTTVALSGITIGGVTPISITQFGAANVYIFSFNDNIFNTGEFPVISGTFGGFSVDDSTIQKNDLASPKLMRINGMSTLDSTGNILSPIINQNSSGDFVFEFSEPMDSGTTIPAVSLNPAAPITSTLSSNGKILTVHPNSSLVGGSNYSINILNSARDWAGNTISGINQNLTVSIPDITPPVGGSIISNNGIIIDDGQGTTTNLSVKLSFYASDNVMVKDMCFSNSPVGSSTQSCPTSWQDYNSDIMNWSLSGSSAGAKTVYVKFRDSSNNVSVEYSDSISYTVRSGVSDYGFVSFNNVESLYTKNNSFSASGSCNYTSFTGVVIDNNLIWSFTNGAGITSTGNITCQNNTWSHNFVGLTNGLNTFRVEYSLNSSIYSDLGMVYDIVPPVISLAPLSGTYNSSQNIIMSTNKPSEIYYSTGASVTVFSNKYLSPLNINSPIDYLVLAVDRAGNTSTGSYSYLFQCSVSSVENGNVLAYPACTIVCNSGYQVRGNQCVSDSVLSSGSGLGGGGGGSQTLIPDICPKGDISGSNYDGRCESPITQTGTMGTSTGQTAPIVESPIINYQPISDISGLSSENIDKSFFKTFDDSIIYLKKTITNDKLPKVIDVLAKKMTFDGMNYFITYDLDFVKEYNKTINDFVLFFKNMDSYLNGDKTAERKATVIKLYSDLLVGIDKISEESKKEKIYFSDIDSSFAKVDIMYLSLKGVIKGYDDGSFRPNSPITRGEFLGILMKSLLLELDNSVDSTDFQDISPDSSWLLKYLKKAQELGINGQIVDGKKYFRPNDPISRAEAMAMLFNISKIKVDDTVITEFMDVPEGASWMAKYLEKAKELGIAGGQVIDGSLKFRPNDPISRAESTRVIMKTLGVLTK